MARLEYEIESGCIVGFAPGTAYQARVPLRDVARALERRGQLALTEQERRHYQSLHGSEAEVGAARKPKGFARVVAVAKRAANNKIVKKARAAIAKTLPGPFGLAIAAAPLAKRLAKRARADRPKPAARGRAQPRAKPPSKKAKLQAKRARAAGKVAARLAAGKISVRAATKAAKKLKIPPREVKALAMMQRLKVSAHTGNPAAQQTASAIARLDTAEDSGDASDAVDLAEELPEAPEQAEEQPETPPEPEPEPEAEPSEEPEPEPESDDDGGDDE